jgi:hypothetical protein
VLFETTEKGGKVTTTALGESLVSNHRATGIKGVSAKKIEI